MGRNLKQAAWILAMLLLAGCTAGSYPISEDRYDADRPAMQELLAMLEGELARLGVDPQRAVSAPPSGEENAVFDLAIDSIGSTWPRECRFSFTEQQAGDYDLNGQVGVSDLTPLGAHFNSSVVYSDPAGRDGIGWWPDGNPEGGGALNWRLARVDGNRDGLINVSDITPIAQHWQETIVGFRVYLIPPGAATPELLPNPEDAGAAVTLFRPPVDQQLPVRYHFSYIAPAAGTYVVYVVPCDTADSAEGTPSRGLSFTVPPEGEPIPPQVSVAAEPASGQAPLLVQLAAAAQDLDGEVVLYEWDLDGDGLYEQATGTSPLTSHTYAAGGDYTPAVRVTDNDGLTATDSVAVQVDPGSGNQPPVACFFASALSGPLPLAVDFDAAGSTDSDGAIVLFEWDFEGDGTYDASSATDATAHYEYTGAEMGKPTLRVTDDGGLEDTFSTYITPGTSWDVRESPKLGGINPGLAEVAGKPAVAFVVPAHGYYASGPLYLALAEDSEGVDWQEPVEVAPSALRCAVVEVEDQPAVAYLVKRTSVDYSLCYRRATDIATGIWGDEVVIDTWGLDFFYLELMLVAGNPAVLYAGSETRLAGQPPAVKYVRAADPLGTSWPEPIITYVVGDEGLGSLDLEVVDGQPAMLIKLQKLDAMDPGHRGVYYRASDETGSSWVSVPYEFEDMGTNALCVVDGKPAVVHQHYGDFGEGLIYFLNYFRADDADGTSWADVGDITTDAVDDVPLCPRLIADEQRVYCCYLDWGMNGYGQMAVVSLDPDGNSWGGGEVLDPMRPDTYWGSSIALVGGRAMLAYAVVVGGECRVRLAVFAE